MINKLFRQMLLTQILSAMTVTLCMLIDSIMIGRFLGEESMSAYQFASPILLVFAAIGSMISAGVQVMCGKTMGSGDKKGTNACFTASVMLTLIISVLGVFVVIVFSDPIVSLLGAGEPTPDNEVFRLTKDYLRGFIIGAPAFMSAQIMVPYMQMSGSRIRLVVAVAAMTVGDVAFDILNVFVFKKGTFGMGLASSLSYYIAFCIGVIYFFKKNCIFKFRIRLLTGKVCRRLFIDGIPTLVNQLSLVLLTLVINLLLRSIGGNSAVASYMVINSVGNICYAFSSGVASVALTLSSIFYADADKTSLRQVVKTMTFYGIVICLAVTVIIIAAATPLVSLFVSDARTATREAVKGVRLFVLSLVPCVLNTSFKNYYQGVDRVPLTLLISVFQNFALTALGAYLLSRFFGLTGVWLGYLFGEGLTLAAVVIFVSVKKHQFSLSAENFSLLPDNFGVSDEDCFEMSVTDSSQVVGVSQKASEFCISRGVSNRVSQLISLCIEEVSNNIVHFGFKKGRDHSIDVRVMLNNGSPSLRIRDNCMSFDPVKYMEMHNDDDPAAHIGLRMVMKLVKNANYVNSLGLNNLTLSM